MYIWYTMLWYNEEGFYIKMIDFIENYSASIWHKNDSHKLS